MIKTFHPWTGTYLQDFKEMSDTREELTGVAILGYVEFQYSRQPNDETFFEKIIDFVNEVNIPLYIFTLYSRYNQPLLDLTNIRYRNVTVISWPEAFLIKAYEMLCSCSVQAHNLSIGLDLHSVKATEHMKTFTHPFISLVRLARPHRCLYMDLLAKHDLIKFGIVGWRDRSRAYDFKYWTQEILVVHQHSENPRDNFSHLYLPEVSPQCFMQIAVETDPNVFVLSEKTAYPIFFNKPFLTIGCSNFHAILKKLGFKLYDEIFDYSFDCIEDAEERYTGLIQNIVKVCNKTPQEWREMYDLISEKIEYNKLHALNIARNYDNYPDMWKTIATQEGHDSEPVHFLNNIKEYIKEYPIKL